MTDSDTSRTSPLAATFVDAAPGYFEKRSLRRHAGVWSLWALGVGAVISGHFSGWNLGLAVGGWGGMLIAAAIMAVMFLALSLCIAEMSTALPLNGGSYPFARFALGPFWGFVSGICEHIEFICYFIGAYLGAIFGPAVPEPVWWIGTYIVFLGLNMLGVALTFRITLVVTLASLAVLLFFCAVALPQLDFARWALNIAADGSELPGGHGAFLPMGWTGVLAALPFAVWLYLAIEETPLAAEESVDPVRDMPKGILLALATLILTAFLIVAINPAVEGVGAHALAQSGEPVLDGFRALFGGASADILGLIALSGLVASFHAILFAQGRQIFALSRAGYLPAGLSLTHGGRQTPVVAMLAGSGLGLAFMLVLSMGLGQAEAGTLIGSVLLNMAVFGAMLSYLSRAGAFLVLRRDYPRLPRPFRSPLGRFGGWLTIAICLVTLVCQVQDPGFLQGSFWVVVWLLLAIAYYVLVARHRLILTPDEAAARKAAQAATDRVAG
ncbi:MAG: amino acid permease [Rhodobacterales bacterium]|nr:amino acid permease [Rhodobacterales bacterium]